MPTPGDPPPATATGWVRSGEPTHLHLDFSHNQHINFFTEAKGFDNLETLSPEVRQAALDYLKEEQKARHTYVAADQTNRHHLEKEGQQCAYRIQAGAVRWGACLFITSLSVSGYLMTHGQGVAAVSVLLGELCVTVGALVWNRGQRGNAPKKVESLKAEGEE